jgi:maleylpyruvate isomerase
MNHEAREWMDRVAEATDRLLASAAALTDAGMREPSLLPGWTRGHVLTHIARNADGLGNLLRWARTGTEIPMYASAQARAADIEAGAGRPAAELAGDVRASAAAFAAETASVPDEAWTVKVRALAGPPFAAFGVLARRLSEVEIHHVDLAAGYGPANWPAGFVDDTLPGVAGSFAGRTDTPACRVSVTGTPHSFRLGPEQAGPPPVFVHGQAADLLAWLLGRDSGSGLQVYGDQATLPALPAWR